MGLKAAPFLTALILLPSSLVCGSDETTTWKPDIPKVWDEAALQRWVTPLAGLNARPSHISALEYYQLPVDELRSYPVYYPGREPAEYWTMLQRVGPKLLIEPQKLKTKAEWIAAGRRVFEESDAPQLRTYDPALIAKVRSREFYEQYNAHALRDGTMDLLRSVPTKKGVALSVVNCSGCHVLHRSDGTVVTGPPRVAETSRTKRPTSRGRPATFLEFGEPRSLGIAAVLHGRGASQHVVVSGLWRALGKGRPGERLKAFQEDYEAWVAADRYPERSHAGTGVCYIRPRSRTSSGSRIASTSTIRRLISIAGSAT